MIILKTKQHGKGKVKMKTKNKFLQAAEYIEKHGFLKNWASPTHLLPYNLYNDIKKNILIPDGPRCSVGALVQVGVNIFNSTRAQEIKDDLMYFNDSKLSTKEDVINMLIDYAYWTEDEKF